MTTWEREQLAWAAGIIDGEGYIGCFNRAPSAGRGPQLVISVEQYHRPEVIERFQLTMRMGTVSPSHPHNRPDATKYVWRIQGLEKVQLAVALLWPWLSSPKREQAAGALDKYHGMRTEMGIRRWRRAH